MNDVLFGMSAIELVGAAVGLIYLYLEYRANRWLWLFAALMPLFYIYINFKGHYYANGALNVYYLLVSLYGAVAWLRHKDGAGAEETNLCSLPRKWWLPVVAATLVLFVVLTWLLQALGESHVAWLDGATSALGVVAMLLMAQRYYQQWLCWIVVNPMLIVMYAVGGNYPSAVLYVVYSVVSVMGFLRWKKLYEAHRQA